jgi:hypothetical protein
MPKTYKNYKQGVFKPLHPEKYKGSHPILYRSKLELDVMYWLDNSSKVIQWGSESIVIPYIHPKDGKAHRYFVDFNFTMMRDDKPEKYLVEVKPSKQTVPPKPRKNKKSLHYESVQYAINSSKWRSAEAWCEKHGYKFLIFTEKHIKNK